MNYLLGNIIYYLEYLALLLINNENLDFYIQKN